jgi:hypothetical protein
MSQRRHRMSDKKFAVETAKFRKAERKARRRQERKKIATGNLVAPEDTSQCWRRWLERVVLKAR